MVVVVGGRCRPRIGIFLSSPLLGIVSNACAVADGSIGANNIIGKKDRLGRAIVGLVVVVVLASHAVFGAMNI